jgi:beta-glucosidase
VALKPGETKHVTLRLTPQDLAYWDETTHSWTIEPAQYCAYVCASSEDVRGTVSLQIKP